MEWPGSLTFQRSSSRGNEKKEKVTVTNALYDTPPQSVTFHQLICNYIPRKPLPGRVSAAPLREEVTPRGYEAQGCTRGSNAAPTLIHI